MVSRQAVGVFVAVICFAGCSNRETSHSQPMMYTPEEIASKMGVPLYPGAQEPSGTTLPPAKDNYGGMHYDLVMTTSDSPEQVAKFYKSKLKVDSMNTAHGRQLIGKSSNGSDLIILAVAKNGTTKIDARAIAY